MATDYRRKRPVSALASDGDVFIAAGSAAEAGHMLGNRACNLVGIDAVVGNRLGEIALLAIGPRGMRAAFIAPGEALVDAIAVGLVGDDEHAGVGQRRRGGENECASEKRLRESHAAHIQWRRPSTR